MRHWEHVKFPRIISQFPRSEKSRATQCNARIIWNISHSKLKTKVMHTAAVNWTWECDKLSGIPAALAHSNILYRCVHCSEYYLPNKQRYGDSTRRGPIANDNTERRGSHACYPLSLAAIAGALLFAVGEAFRYTAGEKLNLRCFGSHHQLINRNYYFNRISTLPYPALIQIPSFWAYNYLYSTVHKITFLNRLFIRQNKNKKTISL